MRKLKTSDIFSACRVLKAVGIKEEVKDVAQKANKTEDAWNLGFELLWTVFEKASETEAESAIYDFLAGPFEMSAAEIADLSLDELLDKLKELAKENDLGTFFKRVGALTK